RSYAPAWFRAKIEHEPLHSARAELLQRVSQLTIGCFRELIQLDVAGFLIDHERGANGGDVHLVAHDVHVDQAVVTAPPDADVDERALRPLEFLDGLIGGPA